MAGGHVGGCALVRLCACALCALRWCMRACVSIFTLKPQLGLAGMVPCRTVPIYQYCTAALTCKYILFTTLVRFVFIHSTFLLFRYHGFCLCCVLVCTLSIST